MALNEDLKKKIADKIAARSPEERRLSQQAVNESAIRERVRSIGTKNQEKLAPVKKEPVKDLTTRVPFTNVKAPLGGDNMMGSFARLSNDIFRSVVESTAVGVARSVSTLTPGGISLPKWLTPTVDMSLGDENLQKIQGKVPTFSEAAIKRQEDLDKKRPNSPFLNTLQAASEEIFLPLWDAVPILGALTTGSISTARKIATTPATRDALVTIGFKASGAKPITESSVRSSVQNTAQQNIKLLESGQITPEQYLAKQTEIGNAIDVINGGQTRFGRFGKVLNDATNSLTQERSLVKKTVTYTEDGIPVIKSVDEPIDTTQELLKQQNKALRGEMEDMRLSNANILSAEIKSAKISGDVNPESSINVFTIGNRQLKPGTRVSLDRETARGIAGNSPRETMVKAQDLIRLDDGSYAFAPKSVIGTNVDAISTIRKNVREELSNIEKAANKQKSLQESLNRVKKLAEEQDTTRIAKEEAENIARKTAQKAEAEKVIKESRVEIAKRKADIDVQKAKDIAEIQAKENVAKAAFKAAGEDLKSATAVVKSYEKKVATINKAIAKAKKQGRATNRLNQTLKKASDDLTEAKKNQRTAQSIAKKAGSAIPTNTKVKIAEVTSKSDILKAEAVDVAKKAVDEAKVLIKEIDNSNKVPSTRQAERLQAKVDKLEGKKAKLIEAYGGINEVPASKIKEIDDAIEALGDVQVPVTKASEDSVSSVKSTEVATANIKPVKVEGTDVETSTLMKRLTENVKGAELPPKFNVATHAKQEENALNHIAKNGIDESLSMIEKGEFPTGTTKASMVSSLMESINAVTDPALKLNYTNRLAAYIPELSEFATRAGQEIEALKVLHRDNPIMKIMRIQKLLNSEKNAKRTASEVAKLEKQLNNVDTKSIIKEAIDQSTCL